MEGLTDAIGFMVGALLGYGLGAAFGLDLLLQATALGASLLSLVGLGGGMGLQAARRLRLSQHRARIRLC